MKQKYEMTIGIECHVQLATKTKLFSAVDNDAREKAPNTCLSPVDYALPGMLPMLNRQAVILAIVAGRALNTKVNEFSRFDRKHYFYPDLPKGYQITQLFQPIIGEGVIELADGAKVRIEHAHLEEDAGKLSHFANYSLVDLNRAGTPLLEIVSMPDIHSAKHAAMYCKELWRALTFAGVTHGDLYHGNMRFDVNISLALVGSKVLGRRAEIKNLNSFRSVERAVEYEFERQAKILDEGGTVVQETRGWSDETEKTTSQRSKEEAADYRYMPEPDIPPVRLGEQEFTDAEKLYLTLPREYREVFGEFLSGDAIEVLLDHQVLCEKLLEVYEKSGRNSEIGVKLANIFASVLLAEENITLVQSERFPVGEKLLDLIQMNIEGKLSSTATKTVLLGLFEDFDISVMDLAKKLNLLQENNTEELEKIVREVIESAACATAVTDYKAGSEKVLGFLVGQVMKASRGKANPALVGEILKKLLK